MSPIGLIRNSLTSRPLRDELPPTGLLDRMAAFGLVLAGVLYIWFDTLGGPIRGVLGPMGLTPLIYLPALVAIPALLVNLLTRVGDARTAAATLAVVVFLVIEFMVAVILGRKPAAAAFELYVLLPALVMMAVAQRRMQDRLVDMLVPVFFVALVGVLINHFVRFPWADSTYEVMGRQVQATREWSYQGQNRAAGFSRISQAAAAQIFIGYCALEYRLRSLVTRGFWWGVGLVGIYFTTSKSPTLAMALLPLTYVIIGRARSTGAARRQLIANALMLFWVALMFLGPVLSITYGSRLFPNGAGTGRGYSSLADRVLNTWPNAIAMVDWRNPISWLVGRGLGGIGAPSAIFEPPGNPADNMAVYLFVSFGLISLLFAYLIGRSGHNAIASGARGRRDFAIIVALLGIGTAVGIEEVITTLILGLALTRPLQRTRATMDGAPQSQRRIRTPQRRSAEKRAAPAASS